MKYVKDLTGRLAHRPYYESAEIDAVCESAITAFVRDVHGCVTYPIPTGTLTKLIERDAEDLDLYATREQLGSDVEGATDFIPGGRPRVAILRDLSESPHSENRLRTTLMHEYGHVLFHDRLWQAKVEELDLFTNSGAEQTHRCYRDTILATAPTDWMEWQAGYASGALLMPASEVVSLLRGLFGSGCNLGTLTVNSAGGVRVLNEASRHFAVSRDAARVRLEQLGHLASTEPAGRLFRRG